MSPLPRDAFVFLRIHLVMCTLSGNELSISATQTQFLLSGRDTRNNADVCPAGEAASSLLLPVSEESPCKSGGDRELLIH